MKDKLVVVETSYVYRLQWSLDDGDDMGATIGEDLSILERHFAKSKSDWDQGLDREGREHYEATKAAGESKDVAHDSNGYYWESKSAAKAALSVCNAAMKFKVPMPEWAKAALANGWKAPKGWKP